MFFGTSSWTVAVIPVGVDSPVSLRRPISLPRRSGQSLQPGQCRMAVLSRGRGLTPDHRAKSSTNLPRCQAFPVVRSRARACFVQLRLIQKPRDHLLKLLHLAARDVVRLSRHSRVLIRHLRDC